MLAPPPSPDCPRARDSPRAAGSSGPAGAVRPRHSVAPCEALGRDLALLGRARAVRTCRAGLPDFAAPDVGLKAVTTPCLQRPLVAAHPGEALVVAGVVRSRRAGGAGAGRCRRRCAGRSLLFAEEVRERSDCLTALARATQRCSRAWTRSRRRGRSSTRSSTARAPWYTLTHETPFVLGSTGVRQAVGAGRRGRADGDAPAVVRGEARGDERAHGVGTSARLRDDRRERGRGRARPMASPRGTPSWLVLLRRVVRSKRRLERSLERSPRSTSAE